MLLYVNIVLIIYQQQLRFFSSWRKGGDMELQIEPTPKCPIIPYHVIFYVFYVFFVLFMVKLRLRSAL